MTQDKALEHMLSWVNCFLTGKAWTGKTYTTQEFIKQSRAKWKNVIVVAPTWIAAINIWWATIHSTFKMFGNYLHNKPIKQQSVDWPEIDTIVIDEISMVGPDYLDYINYLLQKMRWNKKAFGWIQMILVWDPNQLPPVYGSFTEQDKNEIEDLVTKYWKLTFDHAFCYSWFKELNLIKVRRQKDNTFVELLNNIRDNKMGSIYDFNRWYWDEHSVHLMPFNNMVDAFNKKRFETVKAKEYIYKWYIYGKFNSKNCITPEELYLKEWCRIMVTKNLQNWLVNGDLWTVVKCNSNTVEIHSDRFDCNFEIGYEEWKEVQYDWTTEITIGTYNQIPLKLSWAMTIHKCIEENQLVKTTDWLFAIKDIQLWQTVDTWFSFKKVIWKEFTWEKEVIKITTQSWWEIITTKEHRLLSVLNHTNEYIESWKLNIWDYLIMNRTINLDWNDIELHKPDLWNRSKDIYITKYIDSNFAYFIWVLIWDWSYNYKDDWRIDITSMDEHILNSSCELLSNFWINYLLKWKKDNKAKSIIFTSKMFRDLLYTIWLDYCTWKDKTIPDWIFKSNWLIKSNVLKWLFDTDWSISKNWNIRYVSISKDLINKIKLLLLDFWIVSYINKLNKYSDKHNQAYVLNITWINVMLFNKYLWFNVWYKQDRLINFISKWKSSIDFVINRNKIIDEFKECIKWLWYNKDKKLKAILRYKNLSYKQCIYLDSFARSKWFILKVLNKTLDNNFYYDKIVSIENIWIRNTYDIEIEWDHSFVCQWFVSHNSQWLSLDNVCLTYIKWMSKELLYVWLSRCTTFENLYVKH